jgi:predicted transposase YbfD/YdcC
LTVKGNQKTLHRQIQCQFQGKRHIPFTATAQGKKHGRDTIWEMRAKEAPDHIRANWPGISWIIEMISTTVTRRGMQVPRTHYFLTSLRTKPEALLRLIRQRWSIENEWHWPRDTQLHEDAHRCPTTICLRGRAKQVDRSGGVQLNPVAMRRAPGHACSSHRSTDCAVHVQTTSRQPPGGGCGGGGHFGEQCSPD